MRKCLGILAVMILSFFFWNFDIVQICSEPNQGREVIVIEDDTPLAIPDSGFLAQKDCSEGGYNDWNLPEISSSQVLFSAGRISTPGAKVRTTGGHSGADRSSFLKSGKISSVHQAVTFTENTGLYPSGCTSFSHHLISLRKMRL